MTTEDPTTDTAVAVIESGTFPTTEVTQASMQGASLMLNSSAMRELNAVAQAMAGSKITVPKHLQGQVGDCLAICMQAAQWGMNPFNVAQKTHVVNGTLGYEAQLVNAVLDASGAIKGRFHYEYRGQGEQLECRVAAIPAGESALVWSEWLMLSSVTTRNSPLWKTNTKQQIGYLQVKNWARAFKPGALLGVYTADELQPPASPAQPRHMGMAEVVEAASYPADKFAENLPVWRDVIAKGRKNAEQIIATANSKHPLTEDQKKAIRAPITAAERGEPPITYAQLMDRLQAAANLAELNEAANLIAQLPEDQQAELDAYVNQRETELRG